MQYQREKLSDDDGEQRYRNGGDQKAETLSAVTQPEHIKLLAEKKNGDTIEDNKKLNVTSVNDGFLDGNNIHHPSTTLQTQLIKGVCQCFSKNSRRIFG